MAQIFSQYYAYQPVRGFTYNPAIGEWELDPFIDYRENVETASEYHWIKYSAEYAKKQGALTDLSKEEYLTYLQDNGLGFSAEKYWESYHRREQILALARSATPASARPNAIHIAPKTTQLGAVLLSVPIQDDILAAEYAYDRLQFMAHSEGAELEENLRKLDEAFALAVEVYTQSSIAHFTAHAEKYGLSGEIERIRAGITMIMHETAEQYVSFTESNPDYAGIAGTEYAWLQDDKKFMSYQLQLAFAAQNPAGVPQTASNSAVDAGETADSPYTLEELTYLGRFLTVLEQGMQGAYSAGVDGGEGKVGIVWGTAALMAEAFTRREGVSDRLRSVFERAVTEFGNSFMDECDKARKRANNNKWGMVNYALLNREIVLSIYQAMVKEMLASGSASRALERGYQKAYPASNFVSQLPASSGRSQDVKILNLRWDDINPTPAPSEVPTNIQVVNLQWAGFMNYMRTGEYILPKHYVYFVGLYSGVGDWSLQPALNYGKQLDLKV
ncbi:MAG: hypothetical protein LBS10_08185 [Gracilibacteraceae bacterium]|nr:hypothetical protein [Gracilibacteraceae bacterium]